MRTAPPLPFDVFRQRIERNGWSMGHRCVKVGEKYVPWVYGADGRIDARKTLSLCWRVVNKGAQGD